MNLLKEFSSYLADAAIADGGATLRFDGGKVEGYLVGGNVRNTEDALAVLPLLPAADLAAAIYSALVENYTSINTPAIGVWVSGGLVYLDATAIIEHRLDALALGRKNVQQAIGYLSAKGVYAETTL
jgi:hypothetical protein